MGEPGGQRTRPPCANFSGIGEPVPFRVFVIPILYADNESAACTTGSPVHFLAFLSRVLKSPWNAKVSPAMASRYPFKIASRAAAASWRSFFSRKRWRTNSLGVANKVPSPEFASSKARNSSVKDRFRDSHPACYAATSGFFFVIGMRQQ